VAFCIAVIFIASSARAGDVVELPPADVEVTPKAEPALSTGVATVLAPQQSVGTAQSLADLIAATPGVHVRHMGLPGSFSTLSIRGLGSDNVAVVLDDVPLTSATLGAVDLSAFPAAALERIEVYRGTGPVRFDTPLGGVVRLVTRAPGDHLEASAHLGYGSFATRSAHAEVGGPLGGWRLSLFAGYQGTRGDFRYYDDRGTLYTNAGAGYRTRTNDAADLLFVRGAAEHEGPAGSTAKVSVSTFGRDQGIPGLGFAPTIHAHAADREVLARASLAGADLGKLVAGGGLDLMGASRTFRDPDNETGLSVRSGDTSLARVGADVRLLWAWSLFNETELTPRIGWDRFDQHGNTLDAGGARTVRERLQVGAGLEHRLELGPVRLVPSLRADVDADRGSGGARGTVTMLSPRLGLLWSLEPCEVRANGGRFHRVPTTIERFGDGAGLAPNLNLVPERGLSADAAVSCEVSAPFGLALRPELAAFATRASDLIGYLPASRGMGAMAANMGAQDLRGLEASLSGRTALLHVQLAYTLFRGVDVSGVSGFDGRDTPGTPRHGLDLAVELGDERYGVRWELAYNSLYYLDPGSHQRPVPQRFVHDVFAHADLGGGLMAKLSVTNLTDLTAVVVRVPGSPSSVVTNVDFLGYPLPGRAVFLALSWRMQ
jgi:outer membrane cobalamin receptor